MHKTSCKDCKTSVACFFIGECNKRIPIWEDHPVVIRGKPAMLRVQSDTPKEAVEAVLKKIREL